MKRRLNKHLFCSALTILCSGLAIAQTAPVIGPKAGELERGDIEVYAKFSGIATPQDTFDVFAPLDGRVEDVAGELHMMVTPETIVMRMASTEMSAMLDSTNDMSRQQMEERWKGVFEYQNIKAPFVGVITSVYVEPKERVNKGDRLYTIARKAVIMGKTTEPLYSPLERGMTGEALYSKDPATKLTGKLINFAPSKDSPNYSRVWFEADALTSAVKFGKPYSGFIFVGKSENAMLVPRTALYERGGIKYLIMEVKTGLMDEEQAEVLAPGMHFIHPEYPKTENTDGKAEETE